MSTKESESLNIGLFDFSPDWAKKDAGISVGKNVQFGENEHNNAEKAKKPSNFKNGRYNNGNGGQGNRQKVLRSSVQRSSFAERPKKIEAEVKILPETKALGTVIRKLQQDFHAYKLKDLAYFFLNNPQSVLLKITSKPNSGEEGRLKFYQCKSCGYASNDEQDVIQHIVSAHLTEYFEAKEVDCEMPSGNFTCVARCGLSGVLLGPPNVHEFNAAVKEMIRTRYPRLSESEYRSHIEMVRDAEAVEEWRKSCVKKTVYLAKGVENAKQLTREQAESEFKRTILSSLLDQPKHLLITAEVALKTAYKPLVWIVKDAIEAEKRMPREMCFALRGAFHHRKMHFFRANDARGPEFVIGCELKAFDTAHAIPELAKIAEFIATHPCLMKNEIVSNEDEAKQLDWLVSTGHVVAYVNGAYSAVEKYPKYGPQWRKNNDTKTKNTPETAAVETAAVETAAEETAAPESAAVEVAAPETAAPEVATPESAAAENSNNAEVKEKAVETEEVKEKVDTAEEVSVTESAEVCSETKEEK